MSSTGGGVYSWWGAISYGTAQVLLSTGRWGQRLALPLLRQSAHLRPQHDRSWGYLWYLEGLREMERGDWEESNCDHCNRCVAEMENGGVWCVSKVKGPYKG
mgnify:CR=1 FL=1